MGRKTLITVAIAIGLVAAMAMPASAQDVQTLTADPASVDAPGEATFTLSGTGFTVIPTFVLPCFDTATVEEVLEARESGSDGGCDLAQVTTITEFGDGGSFTVEVTYEVPEGGFCIIAGDQGQTEGGFACIGIGAQEDAGAEDGEGEEELANTGIESALLGIIAAALLAAGAMVLTSSRRTRATRL